MSLLIYSFKSVLYLCYNVLGLHIRVGRSFLYLSIGVRLFSLALMRLPWVTIIKTPPVDSVLADLEKLQSYNPIPYWCSPGCQPNTS
jgi:hypothetical protein